MEIVKNKKGFMLVEVIVTSTVVLTGMILLFSSFNSLFSKYKAREQYHDIDAFFATKEMIDYLFKNNLNNIIQEQLSIKESTFLIENNNCQTSIFSNPSFCTSIKNLYHIKNMILTTYDKSNLESLKTGIDVSGKNTGIQVKNETFKDYIDYVNNYYNIQNENITATQNRKNEYTYIILTEIEKENSKQNTYASIAIR